MFNMAAAFGGGMLIRCGAMKLMTWAIRQTWDEMKLPKPGELGVPVEF